MPIFDTPDIPAWMNPARNIIEAGREATPGIGSGFGASFRQGMEQKFQTDLLKQKAKQESLKKVVQAQMQILVLHHQRFPSTPEIYPTP